ncbi:integrator complex subunit 13 isoform X2 [Diorhabda sublineata]|uniref:integrator complex subunit 13 isoform X2 n=1 Tax=Diorhabda sublineata TaxID=1163346 RepID=UPI0024E1665F|nr:integrator complex subunit 13 isoform X2 [Diorhabda sublineata]
MSFPLANKLYPANHKTTFVLDHTPYFGISCENPIEFEFLKSRTPGFIPMNPISKSLWTSSVESAIEYCRIVWDLFPQGKLVRFIASDTVAHILNTWSAAQQNLTHIMNGMSLIGVPPPPPPIRAVNNHPAKNLSQILTTEVHSIKAPQIPNKLSSLILEHYDLASTTVTGIPMKEEQNASSSANYDVEIFHASSAHTAILKGNASDSAAIRTVKDGMEYETTTLKWCTPRGMTGSELQNCTSMHRITPVDVNSRPSLCLINFLLNGRSVMLEMPRKAGGKITSHLLAAHGGEIFIHTLCTARSVLEDPPSISEGCGGRVTDYRITDFGLLIKQNTLLPIKVKNNEETEQPIQKMKTRLNRMTNYWPMTISSTFIFNLKNYFDPLPTLITKDKITDEEVFQCKKVIYNLISLESKMEPLHPLNSGQRMKSQKREEQYKAMWNELETLVKNNLHSDNHRSVYTCLLECHKFNFDEDKISDKVELDEALHQLDNIGPGKPDSDIQRASVIRATTDSPMSPPPLTSIAPPVSKNTTSNKNSGIYNNQKSLLDIFMAQEKVKTRPEFTGRQGDSLIWKLYPNLKTDDRGPRENMEVE